MPIQNPILRDRLFLAEMARDPYFPPGLVARGVQILTDLCGAIESAPRRSSGDVLALTHAATERFNALQEAFWEQDSEIETAAREAIAADFDAIARAYGYDLDLEDVIAPREW